MKTSISQFDTLITFMEQHGDLSKPSSNAKGRISNINKWEELANILNSSGLGSTKTTEKWKKVWADFKNNTKKKAARLHKAATGTGGGPATHCKLNDLEQRVLNLIGVQVATGLGVEEAGLSQVIQITNQQPTSQLHISNESQQLVGPVLRTSPSQERAVSSPPNTFLVEEIQRPQHSDEPAPSTSFHVAPALRSNAITSLPVTVVYNTGEEQEDAHALSPIRPYSRTNIIRTEPACSGQTTPRRARTRRSPRRTLRPAHTELAAQNFLQAEEFWRQFKIDQHQDYISLRREQNRIREMEVQTQREWQTIGIRVLDMLEKLVNKICNNNN